jgi:hypothetical protein
MAGAISLPSGDALAPTAALEHHRDADDERGSVQST